MCTLCLFLGDKGFGLAKFGISDPFNPGKQTKDTHHIYPWDKGEVKCDCTVTFFPGIKIIFISAFSAG